MRTDSTQERKQRVIAATATVAFHLLLLAVCLMSFMRYPADDSAETILPEEEEKITFEDVIDFAVGGSYTIPQEIVEPTPEPQLSQGAQTPAAPVPAPDPQEIQQQRRDEISRRVRFTTNTVSETAGEGGNDESTTATGTDINTEIIGLDGFSGEGFPRPSGFSRTGTIAISVTVDASGRIIATEFLPARSNGKISTDNRAVKACIDAASRSKFSARAGTSTGGTGIIYYHFKK